MSVSQTNLLRENPSAVSGTVTGEKRREERLPVHIPVEITGTDRAGHLLNEQTFVKDVTEHGCRFDTRTRLQCGDIITVKPIEAGIKILTLSSPRCLRLYGPRTTGQAARWAPESFRVKRLQPRNFRRPIAFLGAPRNSQSRIVKHRASPALGISAMLLPSARLTNLALLRVRPAL